MKKDKPNSDKSEDLRRKAEEQLRKKKAKKIQKMDDAEVRALAHELQVHQIELEMQNEELKSARAEAEDALGKYTDLYDFAPVGYFTFDGHGTILEVNLAGAKLLDIERDFLIKSQFQLFVEPNSRAGFNSFCKRILETDAKQTCELLLKNNKSPMCVLIEGVAVHDAEGRGKQIRVAIIDVTDGKQAEEQLRLANGELSQRTMELSLSDETLCSLRAILNSMGDGLVVADIQGKFTYINPMAEKILGKGLRKVTAYKLSEQYQCYWPDMVTPYQAGELPFSRAIRGESVDEAEVFVQKVKEPISVWISITARPLLDERGVSKGGVVFLRNITERKKSEAQIRLQLQRLAVISNIDKVILATLDLRVALDAFLDKAFPQLHVDAVDILLFNPYMQMLEYAAGCGFYTSAIQRIRVRLGEGCCGLAAVERHPVFVRNLREESCVRSKQLSMEESFVSYYAVPLIAKGRVNGMLEVFHRAPFDPDQEWLGFLEMLAGQAAIAIDNIGLFDGLQHANTELVQAYDATIEGWSHALDLRDKETEGHSQRVTERTVLMAIAMGISKNELIHLRRGALLHDIGKMGVPDNILLKIDKLTDEEWVIMRKHPVYAYELLSHIAYLRPALDIPYCHHEKWDGTGYPRGLKGEEIPLAARIFAVVDVWDAMRSDRPYRKGCVEEKVREHIKSLAGIHFDPQVVEAFLKEKW